MTKYRHPYAATHYVLPRADIGQGKHAMVKEADFFVDQSGHDQIWGQDWIPITADGINHARLLAWFIGSGTPYPFSVNFSPPNTRTVGEINKSEHGFLWKVPN